MEIKLYAWLLAFSLFLLVVHGDQKTRNSIRQNAQSRSEAVRDNHRTLDEVVEDSWQEGSGDDDAETDEDVASGNDDIITEQSPDDIDKEDSVDRLGNTNEEDGEHEFDYEQENEDEEGEEEEGSAVVPDDVPPTTSRSPTQTRCQEMRNFKQSSTFRGYRPQCTESGAFEPKQCYETTKECWCVDSDGNQHGEVFRAPMEPTCLPNTGVRRPTGAQPPYGTDGDIFIIDTTVRPSADTKTPRLADDPNKDPGVEPLPPKTWYEYLLHQPLILAAVIGGSVLVLAILVLMLMFCIYRMRKKDEGSYSLDEPRQTFNYTRAKDQEFFA